MLDSLNSDRWRKRMELREFPEPGIVRLRHPVLLCHGYGAIASLVKPSPLYDVAMLMRRHNVPAFAPNIVPYATIETRAARWVRIIQKLTEQHPFEKLNIIAHSMGGLDMRFALSQLNAAPHVASFTTISTPHRGTSLAELALNTPAGIRDKIGQFLDWMGDRVYPSSKSDALGSVEQLTRRYITETFNPKVPDLESIPYYSYSAAVGKGTDHPINMVSRYQNSHIYEQEGINDGMVSVASATWGEHIDTGHLTHLEQMNLGVKEERRPHFEAFWLDVLQTLKQKGH